MIILLLISLLTFQKEKPFVTVCVGENTFCVARGFFALTGAVIRGAGDRCWLLHADFTFFGNEMNPLHHRGGVE